MAWRLEASYDCLICESPTFPSPTDPAYIVVKHEYNCKDSVNCRQPTLFLLLFLSVTPYSITTFTMRSPTKWSVILAAGIATSSPFASAGFSSSANNQVALYWGQNSYGQAGSQQRLSFYCQSKPNLRDKNIPKAVEANNLQMPMLMYDFLWWKILPLAYTADRKKIIPLAFMNQIKTPGVNFASAGDKCTVFAGTQLLSCPEIE